MGIRDIWHPRDCTVIAIRQALDDKIPGYGNRIYIEDDLGYKMMYAHLATIGNVKEGHKLKAGEVFAQIGDTGYCPSGAHLHCSFFHVFTFGVDLNSKNAVDPLPYFREFGFPCYTMITNYYGSNKQHPDQKKHEGLDFSSWRKRE